MDHFVHGTPALSAETSVTASSIPYAGKGRIDGDGGWRERWGRARLSAEIRGMGLGIARRLDSDNGSHVDRN